MVDDPVRNQLLLGDIIKTLEQGRSPIVLTERTAHLSYLKEQLQGFARNITVLRGGRTSKQRRVALEELASVPEDPEMGVGSQGRPVARRGVARHVQPVARNRSKSCLICQAVEKAQYARRAASATVMSGRASRRLQTSARQLGPMRTRLRYPVC